MNSKSSVALVAALSLGLFASLGCKHVASERDQAAAANHYDLGVLAQTPPPNGMGDTTQALREYEAALALDDNMAEAHNAIALLLHLSYQKDEDAIHHYQRALELRPTFTEAKVNLANVYLSEDKYDRAIKLYTEALNDMLYATPFIAMGNLGWAYYKKGDVRQGVDNIKSAVTTNPKFCQGYRNLGLIFDEQGNHDVACQHYLHYQDQCPDVADAQLRGSVCLARQGDTEGARKGFATCLEKAGDTQTRDACRTHLTQLGGAPAPAQGNP